MYQSKYYVDKTTGTFADILLAYGLATLLDRLLKDNGEAMTVRIRDEGGIYVVILEEAIQEGYEGVEWFCDLPFIETTKKKPPAGWPGMVVDYKAQSERIARFYDLRRQLPKEALRSGATVSEFPALVQIEANRPRSDWQIIAQINQMGGITAYTQVLMSWFGCKNLFGDLLRVILALFSTSPNNIDDAMCSWKLLKREYKLRMKNTATPIQALNPSMGKGLNRVKADGASRLDNPDSFWLVEFLKFWGMNVAGIPRIVQATSPGGRGPRDRKTYVLNPVNISLETHERVYRTFNERMWANTAVKMDVLAALRFTDTFLEQWLAGHIVDVRWGEEPGNCIGGLATVFYKDMGSAVAVLNLAEIALPRWMKVNTSEQGRLYRDILEEHQRIISSLKEKNADEYRLLAFYRDFLSAHDLKSFFNFTNTYSVLLMSRIEKGGWAPTFLTQHLEVLIVEHDRKLKPIIDSPGFQRIATAIRRSTVKPQRRKARGENRVYDIRYGLGTELLRRTAYPDRFIQALGEFVHSYNQENAQMYERYKSKPPQRRGALTTDDLADVVTLIDEYGSQTVGNLLVAFGYASEPWEKEQSGSDESDDSDGQDDESSVDAG